MTKIILICAILSLTCCYAYPSGSGVGAYSYQDTDGNRYSGTFNPGDQIAHFSDAYMVPFNDINTFFPDFFRNYENILQHAFPMPRWRPLRRPFRRFEPRMFRSDIQTQRLASQAALRAYDLTYNHIGYNPHFFRFPRFPAFPNFGPGDFPNMDQNPHQAAFASAAIAPGFRRQIAAIDPVNLDIPNVDLTNRFSDADSNDNGDPKFYSVSSSSFARSSNVDGKVSGYRGAETVVNDNGKITKYNVHS